MSGTTIKSNINPKMTAHTQYFLNNKSPYFIKEQILKVSPKDHKNYQ